MKIIHYKRACFYFVIILLSTSILILRTIGNINNIYNVMNASTTELVFSPTPEVRRWRHVTKSLDELGKMDELSSHILFFNRIPHSGSEILISLLRDLQGWNNFRLVSLGEQRRMLTSLEQEELVYETYNVIRSEPVPLCFERHVHFINFTLYGRQSPTFLNVIRDPIDNIVTRFNAYGMKNNKFGKMDLEKCIKNNDPKCIFTKGLPYDLTIPYFCGQEQECMLLGSTWALQKAKENIDKYYSVVGTVEEFNATLEVLESKLPYFFKGVQNAYEKHKNDLKQEIKQTDVSEYVKKYLRNKLKKEYEFYNWIKKRLFRQLQILYGDHNGHLSYIF